MPHEYSPHPTQGSKPAELDSKLETPEQRFLKVKLLFLTSSKTSANYLPTQISEEMV